MDAECIFYKAREIKVDITTVESLDSGGGAQFSGILWVTLSDEFQPAT